MLHTAIMAGDLETIRTCQGRIVGSQREAGGPVSDVTELDGDLVVATQAGLVRDLEAGDLLQLPGSVKTVQSRTDPSLLLCLDQQGRLHTVCPLTLIKLHTWTLTSRTSRHCGISRMV